MDEEDNACPECGHPLRIERNYPSFVYVCDHCGWSAATTRWDPIDLDRTKYEIRLAEGTPVNKETLSLVSRMTGKNFIDSKKVIEACGIIFVGEARDILKQKDFLAKQGVAFAIEPDFPY